MHLLVTGGCGFIGSAFVAWLRRERPAWRLTVVDALTYAGRRENLAGLLGPDCVLVEGDVADPAFVTRLFAGLDPAPAALVHFAAETHVDRSLADPIPFVRTNVMGTSLLLEAWRALGAGRFVQISTDEVYGALLPGDPPCDEGQPLRPTNPYAATKAAADLLVLAGHRSFGLDALIVRSTNTYGPRQLPEKLIPRLLVRALTGQSLPVYGAGRAVRDWLHVDDAVRGSSRSSSGAARGRSTTSRASSPGPRPRSRPRSGPGSACPRHASSRCPIARPTTSATRSTCPRLAGSSAGSRRSPSPRAWPRRSTGTLVIGTGGSLCATGRIEMGADHPGERAARPWHNSPHEKNFLAEPQSRRAAEGSAS